MKSLMVFVTIFIGTSEIFAWRSFIIQLNAIECVILGPSVSLECWIESNNSTSKKLSKNRLFMNVQFMEDVTKVAMDVIISTQRANRADVVLLNSTDIDGCSFLENRNSFHILQIVRNEFEKYSVFPKKCPVPKGTRIDIENLTMDPEKFPPYLPETNFYVHVVLRNAKALIFKINVTGSVVSKNSGRKPIIKFRSNT